MRRWSEVFRTDPRDRRDSSLPEQVKTTMSARLVRTRLYARILAVHVNCRGALYEGVNESKRFVVLPIHTFHEMPGGHRPPLQPRGKENVMRTGSKSIRF